MDLVEVVQKKPKLMNDLCQRVLTRTAWQCLPPGCIVQVLDTPGSRPKVSIEGVSYSFCRFLAAFKWSHDPKICQSVPFESLEASHLCHNQACINSNHLHLETHEANDARVACSLFGGSIICQHNPKCIVEHFSNSIPSVNQLLREGQLSTTAESLQLKVANAIFKAHNESETRTACLLYSKYRHFFDEDLASSSIDQHCPKRCPQRILKASCMLARSGCWLKVEVPSMMEDTIKLTMSHLCGKPQCFAIGHVTQEPEILNLSRKTCHYHRNSALCFHVPNCIIV